MCAATPPAPNPTARAGALPATSVLQRPHVRRFLTLAQTDDGLSCFLVPRFTPGGERNAIELQRLKEKCGNRANASAEIEYRAPGPCRWGNQDAAWPPSLAWCSRPDWMPPLRRWA
ncbi:hypothetical protein [Halomonas sp. BC04]|uniref:hypothetical protein n=1 Tax=Halomonas sp. BC04 TaxID=1403540 RepID=UPI0004B8C7E4|nr:hypothetical protein [Halomonas sp. BC04]